jgi:pimeloyl-ACP methyl ester carboxylesterase
MQDFHDTKDARVEGGALTRRHVLGLLAATVPAALGTSVSAAQQGMAEQVASEMPSAAAIAANRWLPEAELRVYAEEYGRTGFQGGLNVYRGSPGDVDLQVFAGRTIDVPSTFMGGRSDWGVYQNPGALGRLEKTLTTKYTGTHLVDGAGHWVQQEQPEVLSRLLLDFFKTAAR